ncbi:hypothetical protein O9A_01306 [Bartonella koehlerae C-29]|uniref:Uncharacterized protein n=1 Tax=Bartonella koehlerae C-29 TaxID=1134510 RepID=A0A067WFK3_9HYPH|nr:hypothetical protein O9A_01306 [Bartonella koehlerae C-29]
MHLNIITIYETDDLRLKDYRNIHEKDFVRQQHKFIAEGKVTLLALLHSKEFSTLPLLMVKKLLPGICPF